MKGQYLSVEWVLFFAIGVAMVVLVYTTFSMISNTVRETSASIQLQQTGELIRGYIINTFEASNSSDSYIEYNLSLPSRLSNCIYAITVIDDKLNINCTDNYKIGSVLSLYGINTEISNIIYSTNEKIEIVANGEVVELL